MEESTKWTDQQCRHPVRAWVNMRGGSDVQCRDCGEIHRRGDPDWPLALAFGQRQSG